MKRKGIKHYHGEQYLLHAQIDDTRERVKDAAKELGRQGYRYLIRPINGMWGIYTNARFVRVYPLSDDWTLTR